MLLKLKSFFYSMVKERREDFKTRFEILRGLYNKSLQIKNCGIYYVYFTWKVVERCALFCLPPCNNFDFDSREGLCVNNFNTRGMLN